MPDVTDPTCFWCLQELAGLTLPRGLVVGHIECVEAEIQARIARQRAAPVNEPGRDAA